MKRVTRYARVFAGGWPMFAARQSYCLTVHLLPKAGLIAKKLSFF
jgi:hypothetical protein